MKKWTLILILLLLFFPGVDVRGQELSAVLERDHALHGHFQNFALSRIQTLNRNYIHTPDNVLIEAGNPVFKGKYFRVDPSTIVVEVKHTGSSLTPYIGVLRYIESTYESIGQCRQSAAEGPFHPVHHRKVTEIFRYNKNRWQ